MFKLQTVGVGTTEVRTKLTLKKHEPFLTNPISAAK